MASQKGALDTLTLIWRGQAAFHSQLGERVPDAVVDVSEAMRCIAFELPTAAAFHLHRANERVLKKYWESKTDEAIPGKGMLGPVIQKMEDNNYGDLRVLACLKSIKDLHRNPTIHPNQSLENIEQAISLYNMISAAIGYMIDDMDNGLDPIPQQSLHSST